MSDTKHTPGPWAFSVYDTTESFRSIEKHSCVCDPRNMALIATCGPAADKQSQVDAELIAAAPDLLAACKALIEVSYWADNPEAMDLAIAAVAKAEGKQ